MKKTTTLFAIILLSDSSLDAAQCLSAKTEQAMEARTTPLRT